MGESPGLLKEISDRCDKLQELYNVELQTNVKLTRELTEAKITIAAQAEDIYELEGQADGLPEFYPPLPARAYKPMPEWDTGGWGVL